MNNVAIGKSRIGQFSSGKGVFANKDLKKGDVVIRYHLNPLTQEQCNNLPESEKEFTHVHWGKAYLYSEPERYVNHSADPNTYQDLERKLDIALRDIKKGEEITTDATQDEI